MDKKILIKKYENRRLYDATHSRYVNLDEVARAIQDGYDLQVVDSATGEDLTRLVLTQIVIDGAKSPDSAFPLDILREMVVASGKATQESTLNYMRSVANMYRNALPTMMSPFGIMQEIPTPTSGTPAGQISTAPARRSAGKSRGSKTQESGDITELQELKLRIEELESLVLKNTKASTPHKKRARSRSAR
jgi:polyhydroxyalkanoate synthesis repressor PhaR